MAEERKPEQEQNAQETEVKSKSKEQPKEKKKRSRFSVFLWIIALMLGLAVGLHLSGLWDGRPLLWSIVPKLPGIGKPLAELLQVPEKYSLTSIERREMELADWQRRLDERERNLVLRDENLEVLSGDLEFKAQNVAYREAQLRLAQDNLKSEDDVTPSEQALIDQVARTYQDMSARNAAAVVEQLREKLAVDLLRKLPTDARASILGKMKPAKAARLTELMTRN